MNHRDRRGANRLKRAMVSYGGSIERIFHLWGDFDIDATVPASRTVLRQRFPCREVGIVMSGTAIGFHRFRVHATGRERRVDAADTAQMLVQRDADNGQQKLYCYEYLDSIPKTGLHAIKIDGPE